MIYGDKFTKDYPTDEFVRMWWEDWAEGLAGIDPLYMKDAIDHCKLNLKWPPTMSEFIELCDISAGLPTSEEAMQLAIKLDFTKPIVKILFDKITSWNMQHDSEVELTKKFKEHHKVEIAKFRIERKKQALIASKGVTHGSETTEQRRSIDHDECRYNGVRKIEGYLPH
jgi:hypothetical protein